MSTGNNMGQVTQPAAVEAEGLGWLADLPAAICIMDRDFRFLGASNRMRAAWGVQAGHGTGRRTRISRLRLPDHRRSTQTPAPPLHDLRRRVVHQRGRLRILRDGLRDLRVLRRRHLQQRGGLLRLPERLRRLPLLRRRHLQQRGDLRGLPR